MLPPGTSTELTLPESQVASETTVGSFSARPVESRPFSAIARRSPSTTLYLAGSESLHSAMP